MPAAGVVMIIAVVLIVAAVVVFLVGTILALHKITKGLDEAISGVVGIIEKTAPVGDVVKSINGNLDAGVDLLEGLLVKKAGMEDAVGLVDGLYPGAAAAGLPQLPGQRDDQGAADLRGLYEGDADARAAWPRGAGRGEEPERPRDPQSGLRERSCRSPCTRAVARRGALPGAAPFARHRHRLAGPVRAARGHRQPRKQMPAGSATGMKEEG